MNGDSESVFKIFRVLWFPMSINAMVLGAVAFLGFYLLTMLGCAIDGSDIRAYEAVVDFPGRTYGLLAHGILARAPADNSYVGVAFSALLYAWQAAVFIFLWATFGVAICRILALRIARDEYCTIANAWRYAWSVKLTGLLYPIAVALPVAFLGVCIAIAGAIGSIPVIGWVVGLLLLPLVIVAAVLIVLVLVAALVSFGLLPAAVAIERKGTYDSLGKTFNYVFARPLNLILHLIILSTFLEVIYMMFLRGETGGWVGQIINSAITPFYTTRYDAIALGRDAGLDGFAGFMADVHALGFKAFTVILWGAVISYALGAFTAMFLVFRKDVDGVDPTDIAGDPSGGEPLPELALPPEAD